MWHRSLRGNVRLRWAPSGRWLILCHNLSEASRLAAQAGTAGDRHLFCCLLRRPCGDLALLAGNLLTRSRSHLSNSISDDDCRRGGHANVLLEQSADVAGGCVYSMQDSHWLDQGEGTRTPPLNSGRIPEVPEAATWQHRWPDRAHPAAVPGGTSAAGTRRHGWRRFHCGGPRALCRRERYECVLTARRNSEESAYLMVEAGNASSAPVQRPTQARGGRWDSGSRRGRDEPCEHIRTAPAALARRSLGAVFRPTVLPGAQGRKYPG